MNYQYNLIDLISNKNEVKKLFTPGPASLALENIISLEPCFGRGDNRYDILENRVLLKLKKMTKHQNIARMQGSGSFALEVMISNLAHGKLLILKTGYYSERVLYMAQIAMKVFRKIKSIDIIDWEDLPNVNGTFDWVLACYTETSIGLKLDIIELRKKINLLGAKLMLDATASIGLEDNHHLAEAISYSSCKGLFGLTGGAFVAFNNMQYEDIPSFNLSLQNHLNKRMTGPYHAIYSLDKILQKHDVFKNTVKKCKNYFSKMFSDKIIFPTKLQPLLCTRINGQISTSDPAAILYSPRVQEIGKSVVCHLGEVHLGKYSTGKINDCLSTI